MKAMLDRMASMKMNAIIFQVRPNADAVYQSRLEPWSHWISGTQGLSPGFNPFRALPNSKIPTARNHVVKTHPSVIRDFKNYKWMDPSNAFTQQRALSVILDVVNRYDVDGIHIDDYFYPYPDVDSQGRAKPNFPDGKTL